MLATVYFLPLARTLDGRLSSWGKNANGCRYGFMKIATYNVNNINRRLDILLAWLAAAEPDIVCLQELKAATGNFR